MAGKWSDDHRAFLEQEECDVWLLSEVPREAEISGMTPYLAGTKKALCVPIRKTVKRTIHGPQALPIAVPSQEWGETPLGLVVRRPSADITEAALLDWANARLGKTQRLAAIEFRDTLPRNPIGKILKRDLRAPYWQDRP